MLPLTNSPAEALALAIPAPVEPATPWVPLPVDADRPGSDAPERFWLDLRAPLTGPR